MSGQEASDRNKVRHAADLDLFIYIRGIPDCAADFDPKGLPPRKRGKGSKKRVDSAVWPEKAEDEDAKRRPCGAARFLMPGCVWPSDLNRRSVALGGQ